jgi:methionine synthase I (cobalamin-dependent)
MNPFLSLLGDGQPHLMDGAMGTEIVRRGAASFGDCLEALNLTQPDIVRGIHRDYLAAGAEIVLTHTFQANLSHLAKFGIADRHDAIWRAAIASARQGVAVLADVGPWMKPDDAMVAKLLEACRDADGILLETWTSFDDLRRAARLNPQRPLAVSFTFRRAPRIETYHGDEPEACARVADEVGAVALGVNCGAEIGRNELCEIAQRYRAVTHLPLLVRANAGTPVGNFHPHSPETLASWVRDWRDAGVALIGGCCGTTPAHLAAMNKALATEK